MSILALAPMAGLTDMSLRRLCYRFGADQATTEMVSAIGLVCAKKEHTKECYDELMSVSPDEKDTRCQLFGRDVYYLSEAAARVTELRRFTAIDFNIGCPAKKVVSSGEGSALLRTPDIAIKLLEAIRRSTYLPVTVKLRLGYDEGSMNALPIAIAARDMGCTQIAVHGRTRMQQFSGHADWDAIGRIKRELGSMPVIANGDVFTPEDAASLLKATGCDGVMIGRGAIGSPWIFRQIRSLLSGEGYDKPDARLRLTTAIEHVDMVVAHKGERYGVPQLRAQLGRYIGGLRGAAELRGRLNALRTRDEVIALLSGFLEGLCEDE